MNKGFQHILRKNDCQPANAGLKTARPELDQLSGLSDGLINRLGGGCITPIPRVGFVKGLRDKRQYRRTAKGQTVKGLFRMHNSPWEERGGEDQLRIVSVCRLRGSDLTDIEDTDKATRKLHHGNTSILSL